MQVYNESRLEVVDGGRELVVRRVEPGDRGEYVCTFNLKYHPISQHHTVDILGMYTVKKCFSIFPSPAWTSLTKLSLGGNNLYMTSLFSPRESLVSDIPAGDGNIEKLLYGVLQYAFIGNVNKSIVLTVVNHCDCPTV